MTNKRKTLPVAGLPGREKKQRTNQPRIFQRLIRKVIIDTPKGPQTCRALFDTGANIFLLDEQYAAQRQIFRIQRDCPISVFGFSGKQENDIGKQFTPFLSLTIGEHKTTISAELGQLEDGIDLIIPGGWFLVEHPMSFHNNGIQVQQHLCQPNDEIIYDETLLEDEEAMVIGSMTYFAPPETEGLKKIIPHEYHDFLHLFGEKLAAKLPNHRKFDHAIEILPGKEVPFGPIYPLSEPQKKVLREYLDRMIGQGKITPSKSPAGAPILFVPKKNGKLRLCVDYRGLNNVTVKNKYPLPLMDPLREQVKGATIFTKFDLRDGYYLIRIKEGDEWKTAFRTQYGQFEYKVMPFGLCNAPATFQGMMNEVLREFLDQGVVVYLDDVLIYSKDRESHVKLVRQVLSRLAQYNLAVAGHKSQFHVPETEFLGFIVNGKGIHVSNETTKSVREWAVPKNLRGVRGFIGFANFYRRFIKNFSAIARPLTDLTKKDRSWRWGPEEQNAFDKLIQAFTTPPILKHFDPTKEIIIETDASNFAIGCILSQKWGETLHPVAFFSRKMEKAEKNYEIHDKELLAIVTAFKIWHHHCHGSPYPIRVLTDHNNLKYFMETTKFNKRQV